MESLIKVLLHLSQKIPYLSELEHDEMLTLLRDVEKNLGLSGIIPPPTGPINAPVEAAPPVEVPGPVAEPPPASDFVPPVSPEVQGATSEQTNAFAPTFAPKS